MEAVQDIIVGAVIVVVVAVSSKVLLWAKDALDAASLAQGDREDKPQPRDSSGPDGAATRELDMLNLKLSRLQPKTGMPAQNRLYLASLNPEAMSAVRENAEFLRTAATTPLPAIHEYMRQARWIRAGWFAESIRSKHDIVRSTLNTRLRDEHFAAHFSDERNDKYVASVLRILDAKTSDAAVLVLGHENVSRPCMIRAMARLLTTNDNDDVKKALESPKVMEYLVKKKALHLWKNVKNVGLLEMAMTEELMVPGNETAALALEALSKTTAQQEIKINADDATRVLSGKYADKMLLAMDSSGKPDLLLRVLEKKKAPNNLVVHYVNAGQEPHDLLFTDYGEAISKKTTACIPFLQSLSTNTTNEGRKRLETILRKLEELKTVYRQGVQIEDKWADLFASTKIIRAFELVMSGLTEERAPYVKRAVEKAKGVTYDVAKDKEELFQHILYSWVPPGLTQVILERFSKESGYEALPLEFVYADKNTKSSFNLLTNCITTTQEYYCRWNFTLKYHKKSKEIITWEGEYDNDLVAPPKKGDARLDDKWWCLENVDSKKVQSQNQLTEQAIITIAKSLEKQYETLKDAKEDAKKKS